MEISSVVDETNFSNSGSGDSSQKPATPVGPVYTRRLIPMVYISLFEIDENFDKAAWYKKAYGEEVIIVDDVGVPKGWIQIDGIPL
jgi:hypothetical protein